MLLKQSFRFCRRAAVEPHKQGAGSTQAGQSRAHTHHRKGARPKTNTARPDTHRHKHYCLLICPEYTRTCGALHFQVWSRLNRNGHIVDPTVWKNVTPKVQISAARRYNRSDAAPHVNRSPSRKKISQWQHIFFFFPPPDKQRRPKP